MKGRVINLRLGVIGQLLVHRRLPRDYDGPPHPLFQERNEVRYKVRSAQRIQTAQDHDKNQAMIMSAHTGDSETFHKLIRQQRGRTTQEVPDMIVNDVTYKDDLLPAWTIHFSSLAQPQQDPYFDNISLNRIETELEQIKILCQKTAEIDIPLTVIEVQDAIRNQRRQKMTMIC